MQTFVPYNNPAKCAKYLDRQRLGKQRVECLQLLNALLGKSKGWKNHPAAKMWEGFADELAFYAITVCKEWKKRGYKDTCEDKTTELCRKNGIIIPQQFTGYPKHIYSNKALIRSHRSNLLRKMPEHYEKFGWVVPNDLPYEWPSL